MSSYHGQMNYSKFSKLVTEKVIQNLPPSTVTDVDMAPYHFFRFNKPSLKSSSKQARVDWVKAGSLLSVLY